MNDFDEAYEDESSVFGEPYPDLLAFFSGLPTGRVLDLGSGQGRNAVALAGLGHEVTAVDSSAVGVRQSEEAADRRGTPITGVVADLAEFDLEGRYDAVLVDMVLHALDEVARRRLLAAIVDAVEPGGVVYLVVPEEGEVLDDALTALDAWSPTVQPVEHVLRSGEHAGTYEFLTVTARRPGNGPGAVPWSGRRPPTRP